MLVTLVSPEEVLFEGTARQVLTRTTEGEVAFLSNHAPFLGALVEHDARVWLDDGTTREFHVPGGFVEVAHDTVTILVS
jgi:F-type H+-transporting ATPase subunit epsilon